MDTNAPEQPLGQSPAEQAVAPAAPQAAPATDINSTAAWNTATQDRGAQAAAVTPDAQKGGWFSRLFNRGMKPQQDASGAAVAPSVAPVTETQTPIPSIVPAMGAVTEAPSPTVATPGEAPVDDEAAQAAQVASMFNAVGTPPPAVEAPTEPAAAEPAPVEPATPALAVEPTAASEPAAPAEPAPVEPAVEPQSPTTDTVAEPELPQSPQPEPPAEPTVVEPPTATEEPPAPSAEPETPADERPAALESDEHEGEQAGIPAASLTEELAVPSAEVETPAVESPVAQPPAEPEAPTTELEAPVEPVEEQPSAPIAEQPAEEPVAQPPADPVAPVTESLPPNVTPIRPDVVPEEQTPEQLAAIPDLQQTVTAQVPTEPTATGEQPADNSKDSNSNNGDLAQAA